MQSATVTVQLMRERRCVSFVDGEEREENERNQKLLKYQYAKVQ